MKVYNLTVDNYFRNPIRWGRCPFNISDQKIYGIYIVLNEPMPTSFTKRWVLNIYYGKKYICWSNYKISK